MKYTAAIRKQCTGRNGLWCLSLYDRELSDKIDRIVDKKNDELRWVCYTDYEAAPAYVWDVIEDLIKKGLLELPER